MKKIASFTVNHLTLLPGLYVSRKDLVNKEIITTFDIRITRPNFEPVIDNPALHAIEHLGATFLRNHEGWKEKVIYFGPMGCQTGFYLLVRNADNDETLAVVKSVLSKIVNHDGEMFGAVRRECGNYKNLDLACAKAECKRYLDILTSKENDFLYKGDKI